MFQNLADTIINLKQRIKDYDPLLRVSEARTRVSLIDPVLQLLEWDVSNLDLVILEYRIDNLKADYALMGPDNNPIVIVESKKFGEPLEPHINQMLNYSNIAGIEYAGITNGDRWELYDVFQRAQLQDRKILDVSISRMPPHEVITRLMPLWRPNLLSGQTVQPIIESTPQSAPEPKHTPVPEIPRVNDNNDLPTLDDSWVPLNIYDPPTRTNPPLAMQFPGGAIKRINKWWNEILVVTAEWLYESGYFNETNVSINSDPTHYITHSEAVNPDGKRFYSTQSVGNGSVYVNTQGSAGSIRRKTFALLSTARSIRALYTFRLVNNKFIPYIDSQRGLL